MAYRGHPQMKKPYRLVFVCDAGMGSSALGASLLRRKLAEHKIIAEVKNASIDNDHIEADIIVSHINFAHQLQKKYPKTLIISLSDFMNRENYNKVVEIMQNIEQNKLNILRKENILVNCPVETSDEAILSVGKLLMDGGYVMPEYLQGMLERDHSLSV
ncbi:MAG: PTS mannose transporter subunit IIA, partial [Erysipelotrichales bacterium]